MTESNGAAVDGQVMEDDEEAYGPILIAKLEVS